MLMQWLAQMAADFYEYGLQKLVDDKIFNRLKYVEK